MPVGASMFGGSDTRPSRKLLQACPCASSPPEVVRLLVQGENKVLSIRPQEMYTYRQLMVTGWRVLTWRRNFIVRHAERVSWRTFLSPLTKGKACLYIYLPSLT